jgi:UPF0148 protein
MEARKPDDIMAECLLKGGKMLSRACRACGSPLFEVKGETLCVVCREKGKEKEPVKGAGKKGKAPGQATTGGQAPPSSAHADETGLAKELTATILHLARKAREETDPGRCVALMEAARKGAEALSLIQR